MMSLSLQARKADARRKVVMESIVRQALTVPDWQECCAELMQANGLSYNDVLQAIKRRAWILIIAQPVISIGGYSLLAMIFLIAQKESFSWLLEAILGLYFAVCNAPVYCLLYCPILVWAKATQRYVSPLRVAFFCFLILPVVTWGMPSDVGLIGDNFGLVFLGFTVLFLGSPLFMVWTFRSLSRPLLPKNSGTIGKHAGSDSAPPPLLDRDLL